MAGFMTGGVAQVEICEAATRQAVHIDIHAVLRRQRCNQWECRTQQA